MRGRLNYSVGVCLMNIHELYCGGGGGGGGGNHLMSAIEVKYCGQHGFCAFN